MNGNLQVPAWVLHLVGIVGAVVVYVSADQSFLSLFSPAIQQVIHTAAGLLIYLGVTQVKGTSAPQPEAASK